MAQRNTRQQLDSWGREVADLVRQGRTYAQAVARVIPGAAPATIRAVTQRATVQREAERREAERQRAARRREAARAARPPRESVDYQQPNLNAPSLPNQQVNVMFTDPATGIRRTIDVFLPLRPGASHKAVRAAIAAAILQAEGSNDYDRRKALIKALAVGSILY